MSDFLSKSNIKVPPLKTGTGSSSCTYKASGQKQFPKGLGLQTQAELPQGRTRLCAPWSFQPLPSLPSQGGTCSHSSAGQVSLVCFPFSVEGLGLQAL